MTAILGISCFYHDSAAALVIDGTIVAAAQEERFSRVKHEARFPTAAIDYCLAEGGIRAADLDYVAFYEKPLTKFERILETFVAYAPRGFGAFREAIPIWLQEKLHARGRVATELAGAGRTPLVFLDHHESHAASAFFPSPFDKAAILTLDGVGEWTTTAWGTGRGNQIQLTHHQRFPHSLGLLYSAFTAYSGFEVNDGEYKLMGLAPYGEPVFADAIRKNVIDLKGDGSFRLNMDYFSFGHARRMTNVRFDCLFGGPPRRPEAPVEQRHADVAASIQAVLSEAVLRIGEELHRQTKQENLVMAGGVALNCVANEALARLGPFKRIWIQPAAGDAGGALGAAQFVWHQLLGKPRMAAASDAQRGSLLGPAFESSEIRSFLAERGIGHQHIQDEASLNSQVARALAEGKVVGWFRGRMEFGPRALGARSILADARRPEMQSVLNQKIKFREGFRPFAPAVLAERANEWFDLPSGQGSPYMLLTAPVAQAKRRHLSADEQETMQSDADLCRRAAVVRSAIPAVTHIDMSARVQTVDRHRFPMFHALLSELYRQTGCPVLINTSFNVRGEPMVCTHEDAYRCFLETGMDVLVLEDCVVEKTGAEAGRASSKHRFNGKGNATGGMPKSTSRQLREFAVIGAIVLTIMAIWQFVGGRSTLLAGGYFATAVALGCVGFAKPRWLSPIFGAMMLVTWPVAWAVSTLIVAIIFFGLITPLGLLFRMLGRDALDRSWRGDENSYWQPKAPATEPRQYLKQF